MREVIVLPLFRPAPAIQQTVTGDEDYSQPTIFVPNEDYVVLFSVREDWVS